MPFNNPIVGTGFGTLLRTSIRSLVQTTTQGWSINTDGTATFITVNTTSLIGQILQLSGLPSPPTTSTYWLFNTPFGNGIILTWDSATQTWTFEIARIVGNKQIMNFTDGTSGVGVDSSVPLQNGGRPIYFSKLTLPDLATSTVTVGPTVGAATLTVLSSSTLILDGATNVVVTFDSARIDTTGAGDVFTFAITDNGTTVRTFRYLAPAAADTGIHIGWTSQTPPGAGNHVFALTVTRTGGAGTLTVNGSATGMFQLSTTEFL